MIGDLWVSMTYGPVLEYEVSKIWSGIRAFLFNFVNLGAAIWLLAEARRDGQSRFLWALMPLVFGLTGLVLYFLVVIGRDFQEQRTAKTEQE